VLQIQHAPFLLLTHPGNIRSKLCNVDSSAQTNLTTHIITARNVWHNHTQLRSNSVHVCVEQLAFVLVVCEIRIHVLFVLTQCYLELLTHGVQE